MGLDELHLRVLASSSDDPREQENARKGKRVPVRRLQIIFIFVDMKSSSQDYGQGPPLDPCRTFHTSRYGPFCSFLEQVLLLGNVVCAIENHSTIHSTIHSPSLDRKRKFTHIPRQCCPFGSISSSRSVTHSDLLVWWWCCCDCDLYRGYRFVTPILHQILPITSCSSTQLSLGPCSISAPSSPS